MAKGRKNKGRFLDKNRATAWIKGTKRYQTWGKQATTAAISEQSSRISRPILDVYEAAKRPGVVMPSKLRPVSEKKEDEQDNSTVSSENVIVNLEKLTDFVKVSAHHGWHDDRKCNEFLPNIKITRRTGLCITVVSFCNKCYASSKEMAMYNNGGKWGKRGPTPGNLNQGLLLPVIKTKAGAADISFFLASLNIKQPSISGIYRNINKLCDQVEIINKESLLQNQNFVRQVNEVRGEDNCIYAESDTSYNNRPQTGFEAGTQSFTPLIEQQTNKKLVIAMDVINKLCPRRNCQHNTDECKQNYKMEDSISSSESHSTEKNLKAIANSNILKVSSLTCDGSNQIPGVLDKLSKELNYKIRQYTCAIHYLRTFQKNIKKIPVTSNVPGVDKSIFTQKLSSSFRLRIHSELSRLNRKNPGESTFIEKARSSIMNILPCFSNKHQHCRKKSLICKAHLARYQPKFLPYNMHLNLNVVDYEKINELISSTFSNKNLEKISRFLNTNRSESLHHKIYSVATKSTIWSRNFSGLCHSSVHSSTHSVGKSTAIIAKAIGLKYATNGPFSLSMAKADRLFAYRKKYQMTLKYKMKRYLSRKIRCNRKLIQNSIYRNQNHSSAVDHMYGTNPRK